MNEKTSQNKFRNLLKYSIASAFVEPSEKHAYYTPVNLLLIAGAECGKTRLLMQFSCKKAYKTLDLSPKIISNSVIPKLERKEISFIVIPDLIQMLGHKKSTSDSTIGFLNALIEEGVKDNDFYGQEFHLKQKVNAGLITAITTIEFYQHIYKWNSIGFLHRILPVSYDYNEGTINDIHNIISSGELFDDINEIKLKNGKKAKIKIPKIYANDIMFLMYRIRDRFAQMSIKTYKGSKDRNKHELKFDIKGFRLHDRLRQLARAICWLDSKGKRKEVNADDLMRLREICEILNFPNTSFKI